MQTDDEIAALIKEHGGIRERQRNHDVYKFPDGRTYAMSQTPSDVRASINNLTGLRRFLGVKREINKNPERREKKGAGKQLYKAAEPPVKRQEFADKLKAIAFEKFAKAADLVVQCNHLPRRIGGESYWCAICQQELCERCWRPHFDVKHPNVVESRVQELERELEAIRQKREYEKRGRG